MYQNCEGQDLFSLKMIYHKLASIVTDILQAYDFYYSSSYSVDT